MDNENIESNDSPESQTSTISMDTHVAPVVSAEYEHIPEKFMVDGEPDYTKMVDSYKNLEGKLGTRVADAAADVSEYDYVPEGLYVTDDATFDGFKELALEQGLSPTQFQSMVDQYVGMKHSKEAGTVEDYNYDFSIDYDDDAVSDFKDSAVKMGLSGEQYTQLMQHYEAEVSQFMPSVEKTESSLKEAWGNDYDANLNSAFTAVKTLGIDVSLVKGNPAAIQILAKYGAEMTEDSAPNTTQNVHTGLSEMDMHELMERPDYWTNRAIQDKSDAYFDNKNK